MIRIQEINAAKPTSLQCLNGKSFTQVKKKKGKAEQEEGVDEITCHIKGQIKILLSFLERNTCL